MRWNNILYNTCFALNCMLLFLAVFGTHLQAPVWLQVAGRMHPLVLHFPIVLLLIAVAREWRTRPEAVPANDQLLLYTALSAVVAALMGLFLSKEGGYEAGAVLWHQWSGVMVSVIAWGWYVFRGAIRQRTWLLRATATAATAAIVLAGHQGAAITHGDNYLLAPVTAARQQDAVTLEDALVFEHVVRPIIAEKCMGCHNNAKSKGELVMETEAGLLKGGKNGKLWDLTDPKLGLLMHRICLPADEKEHMPPKGKAQLTADEIKILRYWIKSGGGFGTRVADLNPADSLRMLAESRLKSAETEQFNFPAADEGTIQKLNNNYRTVYPIALNSPALGVAFFGAGAFDSKGLQELSVVKEQVVSLELQKMPVQDADLKIIAQLTQLRKLNLSSTLITGATLGDLRPLRELRKLSLSATGVKAADLAALRDLPALRTLYLWNTNVNEAELADLKKNMPGVYIESGFKGDTVHARLNAPVIEGDEQLFTNSTAVKLKNYIKGAVIRYTTDGSIPDSLTSPVYTGDSVRIDKTCLLTTKAFLPGWESSEISTRNFYKVGFTPDSVALLLPPNPQYVGEGPRTLANKKIGDTDFRSNKWLGYKDTRLESLFFFKNAVDLSSVSVSTLVNIGSYIMPAQQIEVWGGTSKHNLVLLKKINPEQPAGVGAQPYRVGFNCEFTPRKISVIKIIARSVPKLPDWHPGKGTPAWVFVDEIFFN